MLPVEVALDRVLADAPAARPERVELASAFDRVLAEAVTAASELPPWPASAMDGFAVRAADVPGTLRIVETVHAGGCPRQPVGPGEATRIMTGAPVPDGADTVVMVEDTRVDGEAVTIDGSVTVGQHVRPRGSELPRGTVVLRAGTVLSPGAVGVLAALGVPSVQVYARPRVAILSTGDEVVEPGFPLGPGQIWSSNSYALAGFVAAAGAIPVLLGNVRDERAALRAAFAGALSFDVVVSTGGVSVGDADFVKEVLGELGVVMDFWRVAMKPGKPLAFGRVGAKPVFGLPGNPVSCVVNFLQFVRPVLRRMMGDPNPFLPVVEAQMTRPWRRKAGRPELVRVRLERRDGAVLATPAGGQGSAHLLAMADAHGLALLDAEEELLDGVVRVQVFDDRWLAGAAPDYGKHSFRDVHLDGHRC